MSDNARKTNLRKLSFLGFGKQGATSNDGSGQNEPEVQLDEECAKVFAMDDNSDKFDLDKIHDEPSAGGPKNYGEKEYQLHRERSYPHMHAPLKAPKSTRRRSSNPQITPTATPVDIPVDLPLSPTSTFANSGPTQTPSSVRSPIFKITDSDTGLMSPLTLNEQDDAALSSESDILISDPSGFRSPIDSSPDRKVQFQQGNKIPDIPEDGQTSASDDKPSDKKDKKHRRSRHHAHPKIRKFSLPDDQKGEGKTRRVSTQPEDLPLVGADRDQLDSHRSDDSRALRRHKARNASVVHIGRKEGQDSLQSPYLKKMYDHSPHAIFVQLDELCEENDDREWKEMARWIKYEEDVEEGVDRWGKPHVASLSFHSLLNLRKCLEDGAVILDLEEKDLPGIAYRISEELFREDLITESDKTKIMRVLLIKHRHVNEHHHDRGFRFPKKYSYSSLQSLHDGDKKRPSIPSDILNSIKNGGQTDSDGKLVAPTDGHTIVDLKEETYTTSTEDLKKNQNETIFKRIPEGAEGSCVLVGKVDFLQQPAIAFVRLAEGANIPFLFEVNIPVRFIFLLLGPPMMNLDYHEVGRSISTLMANPQFHNIAYGADDRKALLSAINEFLDDSIVLPPGDWERQALLPIEELKAKSEQIRKRKENALKKAKAAEAAAKPLLGASGGDGDKPQFPNPLERTRRPFGGLINDVKRRYPLFVSDITDGLNTPCAAASLFMYFAALSTAITFGGLSGDKTDNYIGVSETLISGALCGIIFSLLSGQPLIITGTTGPLLLFDEALFQFCRANELEFLVVRVYVGIWLAIISLFVAALEGSVLVKLFTRYTEEIYAALICLIYIVESVQKLFLIFGRHPLIDDYCGFDRFNSHLYNLTNSTNLNETLPAEPINATISITLPVLSPHPIRDLKGDFINQPNTALMCVILSLGTFSIAYYLRIFRNSQFLGRTARRALGDFGVPIAIALMSFVDVMTPQVFTDKLIVPEGISPTRPDDRSWFINPVGMKQTLQLWVVGATCVPAMLVYVLLFMETHICEMIVDKPERNIRKGSGFHLDIVVLCICNIANGFFGTPWICAATVRSIVHVAAVTIMSRTHAPGEKPHIIEVKEQRISNFVVSVLMGLSIFLAPLLRMIPMAVLFGVFLYMGVSSTTGIQFFERLRLFLMPVKHHPATSYVRKVRTYKMHIFTCTQLFCLAVLWIVKSSVISLAFPFFLILMVPFRLKLLTYVFTPVELRGLDNDQPDVDDDEPDFYAEAPLPG